MPIRVGREAFEAGRRSYHGESHPEPFVSVPVENTIIVCVTQNDVSAAVSLELDEAFHLAHWLMARVREREVSSI